MDVIMEVTRAILIHNGGKKMTREELWEARNVVLLLANHPVHQKWVDVDDPKLKIVNLYDVAWVLEYWSNRVEELT